MSACPGSTPCQRVHHLIPRNTMNVGVPDSDMCLLSDNAVTSFTPPPTRQVACLTRCLYWLTPRTRFSWRRAYVWNIRKFRKLCNVIRIEFTNCPTRCDLFSLLYFCRQLYMFRVLTPIIRSSYNCHYSFWYWLTGSTTIRSRVEFTHHQELVQL